MLGTLRRNIRSIERQKQVDARDEQSAKTEVLLKRCGIPNDRPLEDRLIALVTKLQTRDQENS